MRRLPAIIIAYKSDAARAKAVLHAHSALFEPRPSMLATSIDQGRLGQHSAGFEAPAQSLKSHVSFQSRIKYGRIYPMLIMID
jgi:hypothetical protein